MFTQVAYSCVPTYYG